jgi:hypothetical protein
MQPTLLSLLAAFFSVSGIIVMALAFRRAPDGYEDESGFHAVSSERDAGFAASAATNSPFSA